MVHADMVEENKQDKEIEDMERWKKERKRKTEWK